MLGDWTVGRAKLYGLAREREQLFRSAKQFHELGVGKGVEHLSPLWTSRDQATLAQASEVARHGALGELERPGQINDASLPGGELAQDREPVAIGEAAKERRTSTQRGVVIIRCHCHTPMIAYVSNNVHCR